MKYLQAALFVLAFLSCTSINEADRLVYVAPAVVSRAVLIEDFTGQRCVNCPKATAEIGQLQEMYGEDNVIAVAIHSGPLAVYSNSKVTGLRTELGDAYYDFWKVEAEPSGLVNRRGDVSLLNQWGTRVYEELQTVAPLTLALEGNVSEEQAEVTVECIALDELKGKLQVWLLEDSIVAPQMLPDGTMDVNYVHHHVLRASMNGMWGTDVDWRQGETAVLRFQSAIQPEWNVSHLTAVAFVYDSSGVQQVIRKKCILTAK